MLRLQNYPVRPVTTTITLTTGTGSVSYSQDVVADGYHFFMFSDFPGVDLTDVDQIVLVMEQDGVDDDAIDFGMMMFATDNMQSVPNEDATWSDVKALFH